MSTSTDAILAYGIPLEESMELVREHMAKEKAKNMEYWRPLPDCLKIGDSEVDGNGLFATADIYRKTRLGESHVADANEPDGYIRKSLGGFINHSDDPNCELVKTERGMDLHTLRDIKAGEEILLKYHMYDPTK